MKTFKIEVGKYCFIHNGYMFTISKVGKLWKLGYLLLNSDPKNPIGLGHYAPTKKELLEQFQKFYKDYSGFYHNSKK